MKIVALQAENIKKLVAIEIRPDGNLVQITGRNGQGKTSILDSIWWALGGSGNIQAAPVRKGEHQARIRLDLGEIVVTRTFKPGKDGETVSSIVVENAEGARFPSPQAMLDGLLGKLSFDPLEFARMNAKAQFDVARSFVPGFDFEAMEMANETDRDQRKDLNRRLAETKILAEKIVFALGTPDQPVDESAVMDQMETAAAQNTEIEKKRSNRGAAQVKANTNRDKAKELRERAAALQTEAAELVVEAEDLEEKLKNAPALPEPTDVSELRKKLDQAKETNRNVELKKRRQDADSQIKILEEGVAKLTLAIEKRETKKRETIAAAALPVPGLEFGEGQILMNGVPFAQASDAEKLKASVAIAMALNPKVRVLRVRDGSLLDDESMGILAQMADDKDYQVWVERVDDSGKVGFVIENGQVKEHAA